MPRPRSFPRLAVAIAWVLGVGGVVFTRYRGDWAYYRSLHQRLADRGVPPLVRNLDYVVIMLAAAMLAGLAAWALTRVPVRTSMALRRPGKRWGLMVLAASVPMVLGGLVLLLTRSNQPGTTDVFSLVIRAPIVEELLFRSALVAIPLALLADRPRVFWTFAVLGALLFGCVHATWTLDGFASGWMNVLVAGFGGLWYAWLMRAWRSVLVPMLLHSAMNLGWLLAGASGAGGGGLNENALRVATITIASVWTVRMLRRQG